MSVQTAASLRLEDVSVFFGGFPALDGVSLEIQRGLTTAVIGSSGSGKTLLLKCAAGLVFPEEGEVFFDGRSIRNMGDEEYRLMQGRTGFHFQDGALWANKSLKENLSLPLLAVDPDMPSGEIDRRVAEAFASVNLDVDPLSRPASISMGQQKIVSFLRATINRPEILFLDDSLSFLDHGASRLLISRIEDFKRSGTTLLITTHDREITGRFADRVAVLHDGRLAAEGPYTEVMASEDALLKPILRELV
jgi:ABC-type transporter Mla maintaining outer membrane lipid asymmetry ATPase subunit MlaF